MGGVGGLRFGSFFVVVNSNQIRSDQIKKKFSKKWFHFFSLSVIRTGCHKLALVKLARKTIYV